MSSVQISASTPRPNDSAVVLAFYRLQPPSAVTTMQHQGGFRSLCGKVNATGLLTSFHPSRVKQRPDIAQLALSLKKISKAQPPLPCHRLPFAWSLLHTCSSEKRCVAPFYFHCKGRKTTTEIYCSQCISDDECDKNTGRQTCRNKRSSGEGVRSLLLVGLPTFLKKKHI